MHILTWWQFGGSDSSDSGDDTLPYPKPLARSAFLAPDFDPTTFLSTLENRHQTLEDLRTELGTRSQELSKELLDLVNDNYQDFLSLGGSLKGGEDRVEEIRLGLLGFRRDVDSLRLKLQQRRTEVAGLIQQRREARRKIQLGRNLLALDNRLHILEANLMLTGDVGDRAATDGEADLLALSDEDDEEDGSLVDDPGIRRLRRCTEQYASIRQALWGTDQRHVLAAELKSRLVRVKETLLLDLTNITTQMKNNHEGDGGLLDLAMLRCSVLVGSS